ncbi:hypothetical protein PQI07_22765 [Methylobacterium sp. 092160098-2]|uniref:hypothetical protein n=1 Tax=Methylobacterium sp. 092160098-2 TaxID=3025129 RepID=UPI002381A6F2|nr:hypothetical protein [Methylobacterium sp. 092160098-2]MDE4913507.1 hypothetical protein [Methylobacterium sp. 092160098-2]
MSNPYNVELTDTMGGEPNYSWVRRERVTVPELTHYGYSGSTDGSYAKANRVANRELMRRAKAAVGYTGVKGRTFHQGHYIEFRPYRMCVVMFVTFADE